MSSSNISNTNRIMATSASSWHHRHQQKQPRHGSIGSNFSISNIKVEAMQWPWQHRHQRRWLLQPLLNLSIINIGGGNIIINNGSNEHIQPQRLRQHHQQSRSNGNFCLLLRHGRFCHIGRQSNTNWCCRLSSRPTGRSPDLAESRTTRSNSAFGIGTKMERCT